MKLKIIFGGLFVLTLVAAVLLGRAYYSEYEINNYLVEQMNKGSDETQLALGQARTRLGNAQDKVNELEKETQRLIKAKDETLTMYARLLAKYNAKGDSSVELPGEETSQLEADKFYFAKTPTNLINLGPELRGELNDSRLDSYCLVTSKNSKPGMQMEYQLHLNLGVELVQTINPDGEQNHYAKLWEVDEQGNKLGEFQLRQFDVLVSDLRAPKFHLWAPHIDLAGGFGWSGRPDISVSFGVSGMGYGLTSNDLSWRFFRLGLHLGEQRDGAAISFAPALWNAAGPIPLVSNIWVGPYVYYDLTRLGAGLLVGSVL